jgi:hypothetical protein
VALRNIAADAARRALDLALGAESSGLDLDFDQDLARQASRLLGDEGGGAPDPDLATLSSATGVPARALLRRGLAWRYGGTGGLEVLDGQWDAGAGALARGRALLGAGAVGRRNRATLDDRQVRLGHDGLWHPYRMGKGGWMPDGSPIPDPTPEPSERGELPEPSELEEEE